MIDPVQLPPGFRFGVATAGFQVEGGYNGRGQPANNWSWWEAAGRVERSGAALDFWNDYERHLDATVRTGCDAFRLSVEWARCEPLDGQVDEDAVARYQRILDGCHERALQPVVTLHHFCHPAWLGVDFWLRPDAPERFAEWVAVAVDRFAGRCRHWVTLNESNVYALHSYTTGMFPPGRRLAVGATLRALDHMLAAHVLAYDVIKHRQPQAIISTTSYPLSVYELDRLLADVLLARTHGVARHDLHAWLTGRRSDYHARVLPQPSRLEQFLRNRANSAVPLEMGLPRAVAAVYASPHERTLDAAAIDYYDAVAHRHLRLPGHRTAGGRNWLPARLLWDDPPDPAGLTRYLHCAADAGLEVWVAENGLCNRVRDRISYPRLDGWTRPRYLREHLAALVAAVDAGIPVSGYFHWTLADNYEWGSYEPRFGLYGVDRHGDTLRWSDRDALGHDSAGAYRRLIEGLRSGDRSVLAPSR